MPLMRHNLVVPLVQVFQVEVAHRAECDDGVSGRLSISGMGGWFGTQKVGFAENWEWEI